MEISELPREIHFEYLLKLPFRDVVRYCQTSKEAYKLCQSRYFWEQKAPEKFRFLMEAIKKTIKPEDWSGLTDDLRILFIRAIRDNQADLILPYYDYQNDGELEFSYYDAMNEGDLDVVKYLHPLIEPWIGPFGEASAAIKSGDQKIIDYFVELHPEVVQADFINDQVEECLEEENFESVWILSQMFGPLIDLDRADEIIREKFPENSLQMRQAYNALNSIRDRS